MSEWKVPLIAAAAGALLLGVNEQITWILYPLGALVVVAALAVLLRSSGVTVPSFHGHGNTRSETMQHEHRHVRVLNGLGVGATRPKAWKDANGNWEGVVYPRDEARWNALTPAEQAAVFIAGSKSMGRREDYGCESDMAAVDSLASRSAARRVARRYL